MWTQVQPTESNYNSKYSSISCLVTDNDKNQKLNEIANEVILDKEQNKQINLIGWNKITLDHRDAYVLYYQDLQELNNYSLEFITCPSSEQALYFVTIVGGFENPIEKLKNIKSIIFNSKSICITQK